MQVLCICGTESGRGLPAWSGLEHVGMESWVCSVGGGLREAILLSSAAFWEKIEKVESASCRYMAVC